MGDRLPSNASPPDDSGGDGVRVARTGRRGRASWYKAFALALMVCAGGYLMTQHLSASANGEDGEAAPATASETPTVAHRPVVARPAKPLENQNIDLADWNQAGYIKPGDPVPTAGEVIERLHEAGIRSGIGAFNPPGTSPPLKGLAVPPDFELPPGYVRHHQTTDDGQDIEAILMFSPDFEFFDAAGNPIAIPENRVVPPELAPPGMAIRPIQIPRPL
ncbi:MAG: hypothetical protein KA144_15415 [Xanthomonadaceae bacterium]|nr:hypothetical protein [Xanthomonadaceae bacterium]